MRNRPCTLLTTTSKCTRSSQALNTAWINRPNSSRHSITSSSRTSSRSSHRLARAATEPNLTTSCSSRLISRTRGVVAPLWAHKPNWRTSKCAEFQICSTWCSSRTTLWVRRSSPAKRRLKTQTLTISTITRSRASPCWAQAKLTSISTDDVPAHFLIFLNDKLIIQINHNTYLCLGQSVTRWSEFSRVDWVSQTLNLNTCLYKLI